MSVWGRARTEVNSKVAEKRRLPPPDRRRSAGIGDGFAEERRKQDLSLVGGGERHWMRGNPAAGREALRGIAGPNTTAKRKVTQRAQRG